MSNICPVCKSVKIKKNLKTCSRSCGTKYQWLNDHERRISQKDKMKNNSLSKGRLIGSKNINPYPITDKVLDRFNKNKPPSWEGKKHTQKTLNKMSETRLQKIAKQEIKIVSSYKGKFKPTNPQKYKGNPCNIVYRSSWELKLMKYLDTHEDIIEWASEEFCIPYISPIDNRPHSYFPDFWVKKRDKTTLVIEIKPAAQTVEPAKKKTINRAYINEVMTWGVNQAKWKAAKEFCEDRKWKFLILTEKELNIKW